MTDSERIIFNLHVAREELLAVKLELMSKLQDRRIIENIVKERDWKEIYIYGGANLGIQTYYAFREFVRIVGIVDKAGILKIPQPKVSVLTVDMLINTDSDAPVVITPIEYYEEIYRDLCSSVKEERIILLNELF